MWSRAKNGGTQLEREDKVNDAAVKGRASECQVLHKILCKAWGWN